MGRRWQLGTITTGVLATATVAVAAAGSLAQPATPPPPVLGMSVNLAPVSGTVYVTVPGGSMALLSAAEQVPVGSTVDTTHGSAEVTAADLGTAPPYSGQFSAGVFTVNQTASGGGTTMIVLSGACTKGGASASAIRGVPTASVARPSHPGVQRFLQITANGKFVIVASNGGAIESGPASWVVNDNCNGTTSVIDHSGTVGQTLRYGHVSILGPGSSGISLCRPPRGPLNFCEEVESAPGNNQGQFQLALFRQTPPNFRICLLKGSQRKLCETLPFRVHPGSSAVDTQATCYFNGLPKGAYRAVFLVDGQQIGLALPYSTDHVPPVTVPGLPAPRPTLCLTSTF